MTLSLLPSGKQEYFEEAKTIKTGTKVIIRDTEQCTGEHGWKQFVNPTQKQGRNTHSERKGMGIPSKEEEGSKSDTTQRERHAPGEECECPE